MRDQLKREYLPSIPGVQCRYNPFIMAACGGGCELPSSGRMLPRFSLI